ncbi:RHS repeat-associated core domain-containing protein [Caballeronia sp. INDeC2]|uniref:RHS repeat-associated core domain-containing protein n=1 Tax=Caballeronia sp. INDeC2 TaxID=2921747 RepID=UPI0020283E22|nr:RHS repeat-associated core domain-containing protein [Caballeronia sp. INDeC2]
MHTLAADHQWQRASLYLHEPGTFVPLARLDERLVEPAFLATGTDGGFVQVPAKSRHATLHYQNDHLGTPQELLDESGKVVWLARYKAWGGGKPTPYGKTDAQDTDNAIRYQGQYADDETGLHYNRMRYYDPSAGRFTTPDLIGLAGGINVYQYADANPVKWLDPLGLSKCLYRGVSAKHPAIEDAKRGTATPGKINGSVTADEHNAGGRSADSPYTSWTRDPEIAKWWANKEGPGGVIMEFPTGAPAPGDGWSWEFSIDEYGEQEVLLRGCRSGAKVTKS